MMSQSRVDLVHRTQRRLIAGSSNIHAYRRDGTGQEPSNTQRPANQLALHPWPDVSSIPNQIDP